MAANLVKWIIVKTIKAYNELGVKDANALYFIEESGQIFRGEKNFSEAYALVSEFPEVGAAVGKIYIKQSTLEGKVWNGALWTQVIKPVDGEVTAEGVNPVSGKAVVDYIKTQFGTELTGLVNEITFDQASKEVRYTTAKGQEPVAVPIDGFVTGIDHDGNGKLTVHIEGGQDVELNMPVDNFVKGADYSAETNEIILTFVEGDPIKIPVASLVDVYTGKATATVDLKVAAETNEISADVKLSTADGDNTLQAKEDGLYVAPVDISGKLDKLAAEHADELVTADALGAVQLTGKKIGGATLAEATDANTVATEAAVEAVRAGLQLNIDAKIAKANIATEIATADLASDDKVVSEKAIATRLATIDTGKANKADIVTSLDTTGAASEEKMASEKAVVDAMTWQVLEEAPLV